MSIGFFIRCACGSTQFGLESHFRYLFWFDALRVLERLQCAAADRFSLGDLGDVEELKIDHVAFADWFEEVKHRLNNNKPGLPTLYELWQKDERGVQSTPGYFRHGGRVYMVQAAFDELQVKPLRQDLVARRVERLPYPLPDADELIPGFRLARDPEGQYSIAADDLEHLFRNTPVVLQRGNFAEFFSNEFQKIGQVILHCQETGEQIICEF